MNKKPVALRTTFAIVVILVFGMTIFLPDFKTFKWNPVTPSNFYVTLEGMLTKKDEAVDKVIALAKAKQEANTFAKIIDSETNKIDITKYDPKGKSKSNREFLSTLLKNYIKAYKTKDSGDFYAFLEKEMKPLDQPLKDAIAAAKVGKGSMYPSVALEEAAMELGANLTEYVKGKGLYNNRDVISLVRKKASGTIRLGLDLAGGAEFLLELVPDKEVVAEKEKEAKKDGSEAPSGDFERYRDMAIEVLRNRMESQNIFETEISPAGGKYISLRVPVVSKDEKLKLLKLIQMSAKLEFRLVHRKNSELVSKYVADPINFKKPVGFERMTVSSFDKTENKAKQQIYFVQIRPEMTGKGITRARPYTDQFGQREIQLSFNHAGAAQFGKVTTENVGRQLAIVLDGKCYSAPNIQGPITGGQAVITGSFSREEAQNISNALESGSLPVRIKVEAVFDTDPTLGKDAVASR